MYPCHIVFNVNLCHIFLIYIPYSSHPIYTHYVYDHWRRYCSCIRVYMQLYFLVFLIPYIHIHIYISTIYRDIEEEIVPTCRELGVKIVAYSPLGAYEYVNKRLNMFIDVYLCLFLCLYIYMCLHMLYLLYTWYIWYIILYVYFIHVIYYFIHFLMYFIYLYLFLCI